MYRRPQNMSLDDYLEWVMNNELEFEPTDWEKDCWQPRKNLLRNRKRCNAWWKGEQYKMYHLTYMSWHGLENNPFSQELHASHSCSNAACINPLHIFPKSASENEKDKMKEPGWDIYKQQQSEHMTKVWAEGKRMPPGLSHKEKAQWLLDNRTWTDENGCMIWMGGTDQAGYGRTNITLYPGKIKKVQVHRYIHCMLNDIPYGEDPNDEWNARGGKEFKVAHHKCEQPKCVNPEHIELVSKSENSLKVTNHGSRKITEKDVREIIEEFLTILEWPRGSKTAFCRKWGEKLGVSQDVPKKIVFSKLSWKPLLYEYGLLT